MLESLLQDFRKAMANGDMKSADAILSKMRMFTQQTDPSYAFRFLHAYELLQKNKTTVWVIKDIIEAGSLWVIFGPPGSWKSFLVLDMGLCTASGKSWHGKRIGTHGPVFYIAGEGFNGLARRIKAWEIHNGILIKDIPFFISDRAAQFLDANGADAVADAVDKLRQGYGEPVMVMIDTLNRNFGPGNENTTEDMTRFISIIDTKLRTRYGCAVGIVHHTGLSSEERARGASALKAALDFEYKLQVNPDGTRTMKSTKSKDSEGPSPISFRSEQITLIGWTDQDTGDELSSMALVHTSNSTHTDKILTGAKKVAYDALLTAIQESGSSYNGSATVHIDVWRTVAYRAGISPGGANAKKTAFYRAVKALCGSNLVCALDDFYWPVNSNVDGK